MRGGPVVQMSLTSPSLVAAFFIVAGAFHFVRPDAYAGIMPTFLPHPEALVLISGAAEIAGGVGMLVSAARRTAGVGLIVLLVAVFPANVQMLLNHRTQGTPWWMEAALWIRLPFQGVLIAWVWRVTQPRCIRVDPV